MPQVNHEHPLYTELKPLWEQVNDCLAGESKVKKKRETYLPKPNPTDVSAENKTRYDQYILRAVFYNVTARTLSGLVGQVFSKEPVLDLPPLLDSIADDSDGSGVSLIQQSKCVLGHVLANGRAGLLVDYPVVEAVATRQEQINGLIRPNILHYEATDIINWRTERFGAGNKLTLVVLKETHVLTDDGFKQEIKPQYRVLRLIDGVYVVQIYRRDGNSDVGEFALVSEFTPTSSAGVPLTEIPFQFVGWSNNDVNPDVPPIYDLSVLNLAHYRNSADYEEACYITGQPTPYMTGLDQSWVDDVLQGEVHLGSRAAIPLPEGGSMGLIQASANGMPKEAMDTKERQMVALGAKLVEQKQVQRTATEAGLENASETSVLSSAAKNTAEAFVQALEWCMLFVGTDGEIQFELNTDFDIYKLDPQSQQALLSLWQNDVLTWDELRDNLKRASIAELPNDEARDVIEADSLRNLEVVAEPAEDE